MSATLPNISILSDWLKAALYITDFRPVPLKQMFKIGSKIYDDQLKVIRTLDKKVDETVAPRGNRGLCFEFVRNGVCRKATCGYIHDRRHLEAASGAGQGSSGSSGSNSSSIVSRIKLNDDPDNLAELCLEVTLHGHSVLVFCPTKQWCEQCALRLASTLGQARLEDPAFQFSQTSAWEAKNASNTAKTLSERDLNRAKLVEELRRLPDGLSEVLKDSVPEGIAFHHAGLTTEERALVEAAFRNGTLNILVATSTLAAGVNLPARRVIFRTCTIAGQNLDQSRYQQMSGERTKRRESKRITASH